MWQLHGVPIRHGSSDCRDYTTFAGGMRTPRLKTDAGRLNRLATQWARRVFRPTLFLRRQIDRGR